MPSSHARARADTANPSPVSQAAGCPSRRLRATAVGFKSFPRPVLMEQMTVLFGSHDSTGRPTSARGESRSVPPVNQVLGFIVFSHTEHNVGAVSYSSFQK